MATARLDMRLSPDVKAKTEKASALLHQPAPSPLDAPG